MGSAEPRRLTLLGHGLRLLVAFVALWIWWGFFHPDPYFVDHPGGTPRLLMWAGRLGVPSLLAVAFVLDRRVRQGQTDPRVIWLLAIGIVAGLLLAYPLGSYRYEASFERTAGEWHPYLQLDPPLYQSRTRQGGPVPRRIFCLGGSTTEFTDSTGRGWTERLEARLNGSHPDRPVEVHNLGRRWYTTLHSLINYETNLRPHRPDVVLVMHAINDVLHNADFSYFSRGPFREDYGHFYGPLARLARSRSLPGQGRHLLGAVWYHRPRDIVDTDRFPGLVPFERNLRTIAALARADGTAVVLMTQPSLYQASISPEQRAALHMLHREAVGADRQWSYETARRAMEMYNETTRRVAREEGSALIDLEPRLAKTLHNFKDDVHYTDAGFDIVAEQVALGLEATGLPAARSGQP